MYIFFGIFVTVCLFFFLFFHWKKKKICQKICCMGTKEQLCLLSQILKPFGFCYLPSQDCISSCTDAWQKHFGYCTLYDRSAIHFSMVFDSEPIYFNYNGRTYLIEFWKGQYGVNIGCEVGIYRADCIVTPENYEHCLFHAVPKDEFLNISASLYYKGSPLFCHKQPHWWLTGFFPGKFCEPENLTMYTSITFPNEKWMYCFLQALLQTGYPQCEASVNGLTVSFLLSAPHSRQPRLTRRMAAAWAQWKNRLFCRLYCFVTKDFTCTSTKILYLYFFLPAAFRHMLCFKKNRRQKFRRPCRKERKRYGV